MDERIEYQIMWLEEAVSRVDKETKVLAALVAGGQDLVEEIMQTVMALHYNIETVKGKLSAKPVEVKEEVKLPDMSGREILPAEVESTKPKPGRKEKHETSNI